MDVQIIRLQDVDIKEGLIKIISPEKSILRALSQQALNLLQEIRFLGRSLTPQNPDNIKENLCYTLQKKGVIYARYSSDNQREKSIEGQLRECKAFAEKNDIQIVETYIDRAFSVRTDRRPDFQRMIKDSAGKKYEVVIV